MTNQEIAAQTMLTAQKKELSVKLRWMIRRDMSEVLAIEQASFEFAWTEENFLSLVCQRNCIAMVAEFDNQVIGFMFYELYKNHLHISNFAVHPNFRRKGVGSKMVEKLIEKLFQQRRQEITLEVRETNLCAQIFFQSQEFRAIGVMREHYEDLHEDAYVMRYRLKSADQNEEEFVPGNRTTKFVN